MRWRVRLYFTKGLGARLVFRSRMATKYAQLCDRVFVGDVFEVSSRSVRDNLLPHRWFVAKCVRRIIEFYIMLRTPAKLLLLGSYELAYPVSR